MPGKAGMDDVRLRNRAALLRALRRAGPLSRTGLAAVTGLSSGAVSSLAAGMLAEGLIAPAIAAPGEPAGRGRPQAPLALDRRRGAVAALSVSAARSARGMSRLVTAVLGVLNASMSRSKLCACGRARVACRNIAITRIYGLCT
jgi:hypothetical protein